MIPILELMANQKHRAAGGFTATAYKGGSGTANTATATITGITTVGGETLLVFGTAQTTSWGATPVSDNLSSTYTSVYSLASTTGTVCRGLLYILQNAPSGITSVTLTKSAANTNGMSGIVVKVTGVAAASLDDHVAATTATATTSLSSGTSAGSITLTSEAIFGCGHAVNTNVTWSAQTFGGTAGAYSGQTDLGRQSDGAGGNLSAMDVYWGLLSGTTLGTISYSVTDSSGSGWVCGVLTLIP